MTVTTENFDTTTAGTVVSSGDTVGGITFTHAIGGGIELAVTDGDQFGGGGPFSTTSGANFLGTTDFDTLVGGDDPTMSFAASNAIGLYIITPNVDPDVDIFDNDLALVVGGTEALLTLADVQTSFTLSDGSDVYFLGIVDTMSTFTSASIVTDSYALGAIFFNVDDIVTAVAQVPEPGTLAIFGLGLAGLGLARRRRRA